MVIVAVAGSVFLAWAIRDILVVIFIAGVLAAGISPVVRRVRGMARFYLHRRMSRGAAVLTVYLPFLIAAALLLIFVAPRLLIEARQLSTQLPALIEGKLLKPLERYVSVEAVRDFLRQPRKPVAVVSYIRVAAVFLSSVVAVLFLMFYMLIDAERLRSTFLLLFPAEQRARRRRMINRIARRMSSWLSGQLILAGIIGAATFVGLLILRMPYALALALLAGDRRARSGNRSDPGCRSYVDRRALSLDLAVLVGVRDGGPPAKNRKPFSRTEVDGEEGPRVAFVDLHRLHDRGEPAWDRRRRDGHSCRGHSSGDSRRGLFLTAGAAPSSWTPRRPSSHQGLLAPATCW